MSSKPGLVIFAILFMNLLGACSESEDDDHDDDENHGTQERTLSSCDTNIAADLPEFYRKYFKCVTINKSGNNAVFGTLDLPPHRSYYYGSGHSNFTTFDTSRGAAYQPNPNQISAQSIAFSIALEPVSRGLVIDASAVDGLVGSSANEYAMGAQGVALDSVALFNSLAAPGDDINDEKFTFDDYSAHPEMNGMYHYHSSTSGPLEVLQSLGLTSSTVPEQASVEMYGMMCDGTVIMGCTELDGSTPSSADFDSQNGHVHDLVDENATVQLANRYHTHVCPGTYTQHQFNPEIQYYSGCN